MRAGPDAVSWLRSETERGSIHTVRLSWSDHLGVWRGKRIPAAHFLASHLDGPMGFCDGMIVCDVQCDIIQETPFSNFETGYPDLHVWPDLAGLRLAAWAPGEAFVFGDPSDHHGVPLDVAPRWVLRRVLEKLSAVSAQARASLRLGGRLMHDRDTGVRAGLGGLAPLEDFGPIDRAIEGILASGYPVSSLEGGAAPGEFAIAIGPDEPMTLAEAVVVTKGACKELAAAAGMTATFMTLTRGGSRASQLWIDVSVRPAGHLDVQLVTQRAHEARGVLQPSLTAVKGGPQLAPSLVTAGDGIVVRGLAASSEADPFTALAVALAAVGDALSGSVAPEPSPPPRDLGACADALASSAWARAWLGDAYVDNTCPLLVHEASMMRSVVTDWELDRYWSAS